MRRRLGAVWWALAAGLFLRLAFAGYAWQRAPLETSVDGYEPLAMGVLDRGEYGIVPGTPSAIREPGYPLLIALVYGLVGGRRPWAVIVLQCLLSAATAALVGRLAQRLFSARLGLFCAWVYALHPSAIYYCAYFFRETWIAFLVTALVWLSQAWPESDRPVVRARVLGSGLCAAAAALSNSALLPAAALGGPALWLAAPRHGRTRRLLLYLAPIAAVFFIWTARNRAVFGMFIPGSTHGGEEFYQALIVPASYLGTLRQAQIVAADPALREAGRLPEARRNDYLLRAAGAFIIRHPGLYLWRVCVRLVKFWRLYPYPRRYNVPYGAVVAASLLSDGWIVLLGLAGLWLFRRRWAEVPALPAVLFGTTAVYVAIHVVIRYRMPLMGCMVVLAGGTAGELWRRCVREGKR